MAVYQPPKRNSTGDTLSAGGSGLMTLGATLSATGVGAVPGAIIAGVGSIASLAGGIFKKNEAKKQADYENTYKNQVIGDNNQQDAANAAEQQNRMMYTQEGVSQSLKSINQMVNPSSQVPSNGGTGFINQRLM